MPPLKPSLNHGDSIVPSDEEGVLPEDLRLGPSDFSEEAIENFSFDASAAAAAKLQEQALTDTPSRLARPKRSTLASRTSLSAKSGSERHFVEPAVPSSKSPLEDVRDGWPQISIVRVTTAKNSKRRNQLFLLLSLTVHAAVLLALSYFNLAAYQTQDELDFVACTASYEEEVEIFQEVEIDLTEDFEPNASDLASEFSDPEMPLSDDLSIESMLADVSGEVPVASSGMGDLGTLFGGSGDGLAPLGDGPGANATASFFGTKVEGNRILYVLDNSGGMQKGKIETLVEELLVSIDSLQPKQQFYVIFYSDTVYPLFYPQSARNFVRGTEENKNRLRHWLQTVELCLGNRIDEALEAADVIAPDTVFLLTDGKLFTTDAKERMLLDGSNRAFSINTFGMGVKKTSVAARELQQVAEANRGTYRAIQVSPEARAASKAVPRPYHNKIPGMVWGRAVGK